jgi:DNA polymerase-1
MKPLYILDGYGLIFRSYFAFFRAPRRAPDGRNVSAVFGFFRTLLSLMKEYKPELFVVAMDSIGPTFRDQLFEDYKGTRDATPEELKAQFPIIEEAIRVFGLPSVRIDGYEADDLIADLSRCCREQGRECYIISSDKDLMQLVDGPIKMLRPTTKEGLVEMDRQGVYADKGVWPEQIIDYLSLVGDSSDNVPGVKGVGEKGAAKLLEEFSTLDGIFQALDRGAIGQKGLATKLEEGKESAYFSKQLVTLAQQTGLNKAPEEFSLGNLNTPGLAELLLPLGMKSVIADLGVHLGQDVTGALDQFHQDSGVLGSNSPGEFDFGPTPTTGQSQEHRQSSKSGSLSAGTQFADAQRADHQSSTQHGPKIADTPGGVDLPEVTRLAQTLAQVQQTYTLVTNQDQLSQCIAEMKEAGTFALDTETTSLDPFTAEIVGISLAAEPGKAYYLPLRGPEGPVLDQAQVKAGLEQLCHHSYKIIGQNAKYDIQVLRSWGITFTPWFDTMIAAWVLESASNRFNMDDLAQVYFGYQTVHYQDVMKAAGLEKTDSFAQVPLDAACHYAAEDADITLRLGLLFQELMKHRSMEDLFYNLEMPLVPLLADMEYRGIRLDGQALEQFSVELGEKLKTIEEDIYGLVGHEFNINSTKQLQEVLFTERKLTPTKKTKTGYSTDTSVLEELASEDPVPAKILQFRGLSKLKSTYVDALPALIHPKTGRIHTTFQQHGTATGRMSSKDPNLQNIPIKDEEGRKIRMAFLPSQDKVFVSADYSQIELVVLAHFAGDRGLINAFEQGIDVHRATGSLIFGVEPDQVTAEQRRIAKTINFGVMYGMSAFRLSRELGIPRKDAGNFIEAYFRTYTGINRFLADQTRQAEAHGGVFTLAGRFRRIPEIYSSNKTERAGAERIAVNTPIQGSAADIVKLAMVKVHQRLIKEGLESRMILQVHDELILECPESEAEQVKVLLKEEMPRAVELRVPLQVSVESGYRWGEMH